MLLTKHSARVATWLRRGCDAARVYAHDLCYVRKYDRNGRVVRELGASIDVDVSHVAGSIITPLPFVRAYLSDIRAT